MSTYVKTDPLAARRLHGGFERSSPHGDHRHRSDPVKTSAGVFQWSTCLCRWFNLVSTSRIWSLVSLDRSVRSVRTAAAGRWCFHSWPAPTDWPGERSRGDRPSPVFFQLPRSLDVRHRGAGHPRGTTDHRPTIGTAVPRDQVSTQGRPTIDGHCVSPAGRLPPFAIRREQHFGVGSEPCRRRK